MRILTSLAVLAVAACTNSAGPDDARACQQTYEFSNTGCVEIIGRITGLRGQPLARISVGAHTLPGQTEHFAGGTTDTAGVYSLRIMRMTGMPPATGPDAISLWIIASDPRTAGVGIPASIRDSSLIVATFSPVGTIPTPAVVNLTLAVP